MTEKKMAPLGQRGFEETPYYVDDLLYIYERKISL